MASSILAFILPAGNLNLKRVKDVLQVQDGVYGGPFPRLEADINGWYLPGWCPPSVGVVVTVTFGKAGTYQRLLRKNLHRLSITFLH